MPLTQQSALRKDVAAKPVAMQHRHYATIAGIIKAMTEQHQNTPIEPIHIAQEFAAALADTNPKFDTKRFLTACGWFA